MLFGLISWILENDKHSGMSAHKTEPRDFRDSCWQLPGQVLVQPCTFVVTAVVDTT